jgi:hypothetical protein
VLEGSTELRTATHLVQKDGAINDEEVVRRWHATQRLGINKMNESS